MGHILRRLIAVVLLTLLLVGFAGSSALAAPYDDNYPIVLDHPVLNNPVFYNNNRYTYNNSDFITIYKNNTYNNRYNYDNPY